MDLAAQAMWTDAAFGPQAAFLVVAMADGSQLDPAAATMLGLRLGRPRSVLLRRILEATPVPMVDRFDRLGTDGALRARALLALREVLLTEPGGDEARAELLEVLQATVDAAGDRAGPAHAAALRRVATLLGPRRWADLALPVVAVVAVVAALAVAIAWC